MSEIRLKLVKQGTTLKLEWVGRDFDLASYGINADAAQNAANNVRTSLKLLAIRCHAHDVDYSAELRRLRIAGSDLFTLLFDNVVEGSVESAEFMKAEFASRIVDRVKLRVVTDVGVQIPWNFVFDQDALSPKPFTGTISDFDGFWMNKLAIYVRFNGILPSRSALDRNSLKTLLAFDEEEFLRARTQITLTNPLVSRIIDDLETREVGTVQNWDDCREKWRDIQDKNSVLYIFGHSNGKEISLKGDPSTIPEADKSRYVLGTGNFTGVFSKPRRSSSRTICFINGCRTAGGVMDDGFLGVTSAKGFDGFIGAEAEISNVDATLYAAEFLNRLINKGESVGSIMESLRRDLFPTSIWYSCYADPDFSIAAADNRVAAPSVIQTSDIVSAPLSRV
jgi:hypothetical protein